MIEATVVRTERYIEIPMVPSFLRCGKESIPISNFSLEDLRKIAECWTKNLLEKAVE